MLRHDKQLAARDGVALATYRWEPTGTPRAVVVLTHGHGEYATKYTHVAEAFTGAGVAVQAYDVRGHGRSGGPRGHAPRYEALLSDLQRVHELAAEAFPGAPLFLYGHSLGGQITLNYAVQRQPAARGVIVSAPWLRLIYAPPPARMTLARAMASLWPSFSQDTGLEAAVPMTHDEALLAAYPDQQLRHSRMTARLGMDALASGEALLQRAGELRLPLLIMHGGADGVFAPATSRAFFDGVNVADKTLREYPGLYHEIHNEIGREQVLQDVLAWLAERLPR